MLRRLRKAAYVYRSTPKRGMWAYYRRTGDASFLRDDLAWILTGRPRPRWLP